MRRQLGRSEIPEEKKPQVKMQAKMQKNASYKGEKHLQEKMKRCKRPAKTA